MKTTIEFEDKGANAVTFEIYVNGEGTEEEVAITPSAMITLAIKAMFQNGMLFRVGQVALAGMSEGKTPVEAIEEVYGEIDLDPNA